MDNMDKKLIKQLKGVGFERLEKGCLELFELRIKKHYCFQLHIVGRTCPFYCYFKSEYVPGLTNHLEKPTFPQILAAIKEHTGVDLTKKTKRKEIEELKKRVEALEQGNQSQAQTIEDMQGSISKISLSHQSDSDKFRVKLKSMEDAIKSQNKAIEELNISKPLEVAKEIAKLALKLKEIELSKTFENGGAIGTAHEGESLLTDAMLNAKRDNLPLNFTAFGFKAALDSISEPKSTEEEEKEKALEFGKPAELLYTIDSDYCKGAKVLVCDDTMKAGGYVCVIINGRVEKTIDTKYLKPL